jgi:NADPH-dependent glutamate synthase beta subunit-like oxidoreductase
MATLSVTPKSVDFGKVAGYLDAFSRRIEATPPGICPIAVQASLLESEGLQTCGKCVPCRDGIPQLLDMMRRVMECKAAPGTLEQMRTLAQLVRDTSDCAIGYVAGEIVLQGMDEFADEYARHMDQHQCQEGVGQTLPCETMCPAHVNIPAYIALTGEGDYAGAIKMIRKDNPFPTACALICEHPCEKRCRRMLIDAPVNIRGIKKFAVDSLHADQVKTPAPLPSSGRRVAVIGGGPSGMTCAYFLSLMGHAVTVFEMHKELGGMTRYGIPAYRFPRHRLDEDNRAILSTGNIEVRLETYVGTEEMRKIAGEYDAVYVAIGAHTGKGLKLDGIDAKGVMSAVELLGAIGDGDYPDFTGKSVVVIGGGNVAMDCARTSIRAGAKDVTVAYRRRLEDMTALPAEVESAMQEGIEMMTLQAPVRIEADDDGNAVRLICQPQYIGPVKRRRPAPVSADKPEVSIEADVILIAVGQDIVSAPFEEFGMQTNRSCFVADENLRAAGFENIFVGGDCQTGPKSAIMAIGAGKVAARNIDEYLGFHHTLDPEVEAPDPKPNDRTAYGRVNIAERPARERKNDFDYVEVDMSLEEALQECGRCLRCDHYGCGIMEGGRVQYA